MTTVSGVLRSREGDIFLPQTHASLVSGLSTVATSGSYNDLSNKPDLTGFITNSVNDLINYYKKTETYTQTEINNLIGAIQQFRYEIVASTSAVTEPASNVLYLIGPTGSGADKYEEYVYANSTWTKIGDTSIDLSGYVTTTALNTALSDYALSSTIPTALSDLTDDSTHRTVTDTEKEQWMPRIYIGTCGTSASTVNKVVTVESFPVDGNGEPLIGTMIGVKFTNTNSATAPKLNVNETGAASIWYNNAAATSTSSVYGGSAERYTYYVWDGTYWVWVTHGTDNNDNTLAYNVRYNSASKTTIDKFARYRILFTSADDAHWVPANTSTSTNATASRTVNQTPINPFGQIVYYGSTTSISAGGTPSASVLYTQYALTFGYSFNRTGAALTLTTKAPVYIKCAPQSNGSAIIDADTPYVQSLPSTEDGKIYIYLGIASSATAVEMSIVHPVYYYKDGAIRPWINAASQSDSLKYIDEEDLADGIELARNGDVIGQFTVVNKNIYSQNTPTTVATISGTDQDEINILTYHKTNGSWIQDSSHAYKLSDNVKFSSQSLTDAQKTQARTNIGASALGDDILVINNDPPLVSGTIQQTNFATLFGITEQEVYLIFSGKKTKLYYENPNTGSAEGTTWYTYFVLYTRMDELSSYRSMVLEYGSKRYQYWSLAYDTSEYYDIDVLAEPAIPTISTNIVQDKTSNVKTASPKAVYDEVHPAVQSTQPQGGFLPNVEYNLGTLTGNVTFALASAVSGISNKWYWCFKAGATAPTITWPTGLLWPEPDAAPPTIEANDEVEVEVKNGHIVALVFKPTS